MKFSVVIPVYNGADTIVRAIESVLSQTYVAHEIIVVDDASTDGTTALLRDKYPDSIHLIELANNSGSSVARNAGMDAATGDYIAFLDDDDTWHRDKLKIVNDVLAKQPSIAFLFHISTMADFDKLPPPQYSVAEKWATWRMFTSNVIQTPCVVMKNDPAFRFEPSMRHMEDYDLWMRIALRQGVYFIMAKLTRLFRPVTSPGGISADRWQMRKGEMRVFVRLVRVKPLFIFLLPLLLLFSITKHMLRMWIEYRKKRNKI